MSEPAQRRWPVDEFFAWQKDQPLRYELVGGFPVRLMAGATNVHDDIVVNLIAELRALAALNPPSLEVRVEPMAVLQSARRERVSTSLAPLA